MRDEAVCQGMSGILRPDVPSRIGHLRRRNGELRSWGENEIVSSPLIYMTKYSLFKIKEGKKQVWLDWCFKLQNEYAEEARETLKEENLTQEKCLVYDEYVFYKHTTLDGKEKLPFNPTVQLNLEHDAKMKECLERVMFLNVSGNELNGYDLSV